MSRRKKPKKFEPGQAVMVRRRVGGPWEPATYRKKYSDWRGWHSVELLEGEPRYIDTMSGMETTADNPSAVRSSGLSVPTQRVRARKEYE